MRSINRIIAYILSLLFILSFFDNGFTQTTTNPKISVVGETRIHVQNNTGNESNNNKLRIDSPGLEFIMQGYLNPYARADVLLHKHLEESGIEVEEAYFTLLKGLPLGFQMLAGKYLVDFGYLNKVHEHAFPFIFRPRVHNVFLGDEGLSDVGIQFNTLFPIGDDALTLSFNVLKGDFLTHTHEHDETHEPEEDELLEENAAYSGRLSWFRTMNDYHHILIGTSALTGIHDPEHDRRFWYWGLDWKYKWRPDKYRSFILQGEFLLDKRELDLQDVTSKGMYAYAKYQFLKMFHLGLKYDWTEGTDESPDLKQEAFSMFGEFSPFDDTSAVRFIYERDIERNDNLFLLQLIFLLGPHRPHQF